MKKTALILSALSVCSLPVNAGDSSPIYKTPYSINFDVPLAELTAPDATSPRNNLKEESIGPYRNWYAPATLKECGSWGPRARTYPAIAGADSLSVEWKRQRLVAVATKHLNLPYQHHHIPDWNPPPTWPWKPVPLGRNSPGLDCSNFTSWVYNYGLGIKFTSDVHKQSNAVSAPAAGGVGTVTFKQIPAGTEYGSLVKQLRAGDLLFIRHKNDEVVSHVVMWLGKYGQSPDGTPLIIDCTATNQVDCNGVTIPGGVQIRPFTKSSWYFNRFHHASRILTSTD